MKKKILIAMVVIALVIVAKGLLNKRKSEIANDVLPVAQKTIVPLVKAKEGTLQNEIPFLAQILSQKSIKLSTKLAGYVEKVMVQEAQNVKKGDLLVSIDATELKSNIKALQANKNAQVYDLKLTKSIYKRNIKLQKIGGLAQEKLDLSKASWDAKKAQLSNTVEKIAQLEHQLSYLQIKAPFDGEIDALYLHEGDLAAAGKAILSMSNKKQKLLFAYTPTKQSQIKKEQDVFLDGEQVGYVKAIYASSQNGLVTAEVALSKALTYPTGTSVNILVRTQKAKGCLLPANTLLHKKEGTFVMVYKEGRYSPLKVNIEMQSDDLVLLSPCPKTAVAQASEVKLAALPAYNKAESDDE